MLSKELWVNLEIMLMQGYCSLVSNRNVTEFWDELNGSKKRGPLLFTISAKTKFKIGHFESSQGCPGLPIDPNTLSENESLEVNWVEIEFQDIESEFNLLCQFCVDQFVPNVSRQR